MIKTCGRIPNRVSWEAYNITAPKLVSTTGSRFPPQVIGPPHKLAARFRASRIRERSLQISDAKNRRAARQAFHALVEALIENGMAKRRDDAESLVFRFSLLANAHPNADLATLRRICLYFQNNLLSRTRKAQTGAVAVACIEFLRHRDLDVLETDLVRDPYTPTTAQAKLQ
jgi:hypothetical protein